MTRSACIVPPARVVVAKTGRGWLYCGLLGLSLSLLAGAAPAGQTPDPVEQHNSSAIWFENWVGLRQARLVVTRPNGKMDQILVESGTPVYELERGAVQDGVYRYELSAATEDEITIVNPIDNGRGEIATSRAKPFYASGSFTVSRGVIITPEDIREE